MLSRHSLRLPISFDEVPYFKDSFRGDLIITEGVIYYFPHTNTLDKSQRFEGIVAHIAAELVGPVAIPLQIALHSVGYYIRASVNKPKIREQGLWKPGENGKAFQKRLDAYVEAEKRQPLRLTGYEYNIPRPMRFAKGEIHNICFKGGLRFETEFDSHDFRIPLYRRRLLRDALWIAGLPSNR